MGIKKYKPTSAARRATDGLDFAEITKAKPEKKLTEPIRKTGGRNTHGHITTPPPRRRPQARYRVIDFKRDKDGVPAKVAAIEYDPNRTARIALLHYADGEKRYILAPVGLTVGDTLVSGRARGHQARQRLPLNIPLGTVIHNVELQPGGGRQLIRSAGSCGQLMAKEGDYAQIRLPSGEVRKVHLECRATIGQVSNIEHDIVVRSARPATPLAGHPPAQPRRGDEPGRSPAGRRRGQVRAGSRTRSRRGARRPRASRRATTSAPTSSSS